ncbi:hypothetical protein PLANPX_2235 [Lacipirellula parvula]|uniref:Uncharacterized protein n=1 Tax=Lacipirellula parvula TaxID=2650471 RepID=A0A5K7XEG2_9BACT|nr:hypothetical protein PLANPX_2235 [Lacipirellula parvula]
MLRGNGAGEWLTWFVDGCESLIPKTYQGKERTAKDAKDAKSAKKKYILPVFPWRTWRPWR